MYGYSSRFAKQLFSSTSVTAVLGPVITKYRRGILTRKPQAKSTSSSPPSPSRQQLCEPFRPCSGADQDLARSSRTFNFLLTEHMGRRLTTSPENPPFFVARAIVLHHCIAPHSRPCTVPGPPVESSSPLAGMLLEDVDNPTPRLNSFHCAKSHPSKPATRGSTGSLLAALLSAIHIRPTGMLLLSDQGGY